MALVKMKDLLLRAQKENKGCGAFSVGNMEMVKGAIKAAEELDTPIILQIAEVRLDHSPLHLMGPMMLEAARNAKVDVAVHLDHGLKFETIKKALEYGFTSVMLDASRDSFEENIEKLSYYPAASKNHHEYVSGLAYHTYGMLKVAESFCTLYPTLNKDLLYSGITLHDLGKTIELSGPVVPEYTLEGKLLGHISISNAMIKETANKLHIEGEEVTLLQHMILAHHGKNEYGSPVLPQIKEAEILYLIDNIDARMAMMDKALETVEYGKFTKRVFSLENRALYKPKMYEK